MRLTTKFAFLTAGVGLALPLLALLLMEGALRVGLLDPYREYTRAYNPAATRQSKAPDHVRIVALGDSMTAGPNAYPAFLTERLRAGDRTRQYETLNLAVPGTGPNVYYRRLTTLGLRYQPDLVTVGIYVGNDLANVRDPYAATTVVNAVHSAVKTHSHLAVFVKTKADALRFRLAPPASPSFAHAATRDADPKRQWLPVLNPFTVEGARQHPDYLLQSLLLTHPGFEAVLEEVLAILRTIDEQCRRIGARALFVIIPAPVQVHRDYHPFYRDLGYAVSDRLLGGGMVQSRMIRFFHEHNLRYLDLLPAFRAFATEYFYYLNDEHWNPRGHEFAGARIAAFLAEHPDLLPSRRP